ncbi:uncharacterized protein LOC128965618 [Oppia nitens]|uniref:uncharacterized protein LOC128965618 n=1 Tax=Oppia nitens TaxID=1686743 RepID=UPI0023DCC82D|nr:uncharacterized protein LOC128965618 [Oppia nitens]
MGSAVSLIYKQNKCKVKVKQFDKTNHCKHGDSWIRWTSSLTKPLNLSITETTKTNKFNESFDYKKTNNTDQNVYYVYQSDTKCLNKELMSSSAPNVKQFEHKLSSKDCQRSQSMITSKPNRIRNIYYQRVVFTPEYINMSSTEMTKTTVISKKDPLIDYDLVPSGIPVPINSLRAKHLKTKNIRSLVMDDDHEYDIPKKTQLIYLN